MREATIVRKRGATVGFGEKISSFINTNTPVYLMLAPNFILFMVFVLYPLLWSLRFMFYRYDGLSDPLFIGLDNFVRAFTRDPVWWQSVGNTFIFAFWKLLIEIPLAVVLAVCLNTKIPGKNFLRGIFFLPNITSGAVMGVVFMLMFSSYNGFFNRFLTNIGVITQNINWLQEPKYAMVSVILVSVWQNFGQNMLLVFSGLQNIPKEMYESAEIDGANAIQSFFYITIPMLAPMLQVILMLAIIGSLHAFDGIFVLTGGGPAHATEVMGISVYNQFFAGDTVAAYGYGATLGFLSSIIIGIMTIFYLIVSHRMKKIY